MFAGKTFASNLHSMNYKTFQVTFSTYHKLYDDFIICQFGIYSFWLSSTFMWIYFVLILIPYKTNLEARTYHGSLK